ncbi:hypothetical protein [Peredibacter starrii]|uniref:Uncharacterized protein n=1 Tax=Peredibacter starrii TaxID=28202 RepID=A0AAX4HMQ1_9BACT|nr:hypothetical protein [Peredibacter starrii]WPU64164.1 hypothetical protein SOO65_15830 [Peredibacter starrii]
MRLFWFFFIVIMMVSCGSGKKVSDQPADDTMTPPSEQSAITKQESTEIAFKKGSGDLTPQAKKELERLYEKFNHDGVSKVKAVTWGDLEYPSVHNSKDIEDDTTLVVKRNMELGTYLKKLTENENIEMFNMAERSAAVNKISTDENIKVSLESAGIPNTDTAVKVPGKASKSIVIFIKEEE